MSLAMRKNFYVFDICKLTESFQLPSSNRVNGKISIYFVDCIFNVNDHFFSSMMDTIVRNMSKTAYYNQRCA